MTPPSKSSKLHIVGRCTSVTYLRLEPGIGWTACPLLICIKFEVGRFLARLDHLGLLPVIDGSHLGSLGITGKRF